MDIDRRRVAQKFVNRGKIEISLPALGGGAPEHYLRDVMFAHKLRNFFSHHLAFSLRHLRPYALCEADIVSQGALIFVALIGAGVDVENE